MRHAALLLLTLLACCAVPPPEAYTTAAGRGRLDQSVDLGANGVGEACVQASSSRTAAEVYCGGWQQPSARVRTAGAAGDGNLTSIATSGAWRSSLDSTYDCGAPQSTSLAGANAVRLDCTRRAGGWPYVAVVALSGGQAWVADGVVSSLPAIGKSIAVLSGRERAVPVTSAAVEAMQAQREGARARATGDVREFDSLMLQGARANLADNSAASESAYGAALGLQEKALGKDNPNVADPLLHVALQISNQGRYAEADVLFKRAEALAAKQQGDSSLTPRLLHYEGLHAYNQHKLDAALGLLKRADDGYVAALPPEALRAQPNVSRNSVEASLSEVLTSPAQRQSRVALSGLIEARRYQAVVLRDLNRKAESDLAMKSAEDVARNAALDRAELTARLSRTAAVSASLAGDRALALSSFRASNGAFQRAYPASRPLALIGLLRAKELVQSGDAEAAVPVCRASIAVLLEIKSAFEPERMGGCLDGFAAAAAVTKDAETKQALLRDMFRAAQLVRGSTTSQQIQQASARLAEGGGNSKVAVAIRDQQDAAGRLNDIRRRREAVAQAARDGTPAPADAATLDEEERKAQLALASKESDLQAAAPNYDQLIQQATSAEDVLKALKPGEAFASITMTQDGGYVFLLRDGTVQLGHVAGGSKVVDKLVTRIRAGMEPTMPAFDLKAAETLFKAVFGDVSAGLDGVKALTVAPSGSLLSLPFSVLLTGPGDPAALGGSPWLVKRMAVGHVPSAGNFVALRRVAGSSKAAKPWFGFGDFRPVTLAQARRSFPAACGDSADLLAKIPPLPSAKQELEFARRVLGGGTEDQLLGTNFTAPAVEKESLSSYRVLHFATHAILPSELKCQGEPALITSAPNGAADASGALLKASDLAQIKLDADLVILSACNSGGPDGSAGGGESLSTLARSFFYGGARSLLVTHWEVSDQAATFMVVETLRRMRADPGLGVATALREAQNEILTRAGGSLPAEFAHPFFWAPFALIGQAALPVKGAS